DLAILHIGLIQYERALRSYPALKSLYQVGYYVWEQGAIPAHYHSALREVDEVWTASHYCAEQFRPFADQIYVVPHVVNPPRPVAAEALRQVARAIDYDESEIYFFAVTTLSDQRKNGKALTGSFIAERHHMRDARL